MVRSLHQMFMTDNLHETNVECEAGKLPANVIELKSSSFPAHDQEYFQSYAHYGIHHEMLIDKVRTESYRDVNAFLLNTDLLNRAKVSIWR